MFISIKRKAEQLLQLTIFSICFSGNLHAEKTLPFAKRFVGRTTFAKIVKKAKQEKWQSLKIGDRVAKVALALRGKPYKALTLELDNFVETPSVNLDALDCWTLFEISLGMARMMSDKDWSEKALLEQIRFTRYRGGREPKSYLDRIHFLSEWIYDNRAKNVVADISKKIGGKRMQAKDCREMTKLWQYYPAMKANPHFLKAMGKHEKRISRLPIYIIPKGKTHAVEGAMRNGDIVAIATHKPGVYFSHVGIAVKRGTETRLLHASSDFKKVVLDAKISKYLHRYKKHAGIAVFRPLESSANKIDAKLYRRHLADILGSYDFLPSEK